MMVWVDYCVRFYGVKEPCYVLTDGIANYVDCSSCGKNYYVCDWCFVTESQVFVWFILFVVAKHIAWPMWMWQVVCHKSQDVMWLFTWVVVLMNWPALHPLFHMKASHSVFHNVRLDFLHNRIDILSWRQAFAWHQARLSQVWENVKLHAFIYTCSVLENVCVYNIILIEWIYTISFGHISFGWCYYLAEDIIPQLDGMYILVVDVVKGWFFLPITYIGFWQMLLPTICGRCFNHIYNTGADVITSGVIYVDWC